MNEPQSEQPAPRRVHPLEQKPAPPPENAPPRQRVNLRIPAVRPLATYALIAANIAVFLIRATSVEVSEQLLLWGANYAPAVLNGEYYRLFTSMFLHAGILTPSGSFVLQNSLHLVFNMYLLYAIGLTLEPLFGHARFLIVYLLGGLGGSVLSMMLGSGYSVGASGAVFAILGAEFAYLYHHRKLMGAAGRARRQSLIILGVINLAFGLLSTLPGSAIRIDNWGHLGGLAGGLLLAWFISPIFMLKKHPDHPDEFLAVDINPLGRRYWIVSVYATVLVVVVFLRVTTAGG